ncbi:MAG: hypothetical protein ABII90_10310 [Bacteroidota bacterium]
MSKKISTSITFLILISMILTSCKKYSEGPFFSFRTAEQRLLGTWEIKEFKIDGQDFMDSLSMDSAFCTYLFERIKSDSREYYRSCPGGFYLYFWGYWHLENKNKELWLDEYNSNYNSPTYGPLGRNEDICWTILRLKNKEMKLKTDWNGKEYEIFFDKIKD